MHELTAVVDQARQELRQKRGGGSLPVALNDAIPATPAALDAVETLDLDRALQKLEQIDPDEAKIVELRF